MRKSTISVVFLIVLFSSFFILPSHSFAHLPSVWPTGYWANGTDGSGPGLLSCVGAGAGGSDGKTCTSLCDLGHTFVHFVYFGISLMIFAIAPVLIMIGGVFVLSAGASSENLARGRKIIMGAAAGVVIVLLAFLIVNTLLVALSGSGLGMINCIAGSLPSMIESIA